MDQREKETPGDRRARAEVEQQVARIAAKLNLHSQLLTDLERRIRGDQRCDQQ